MEGVLTLWRPALGALEQSLPGRPHTDSTSQHSAAHCTRHYYCKKGLHRGLVEPGASCTTLHPRPSPILAPESAADGNSPPQQSLSSDPWPVWLVASSKRSLPGHSHLRSRPDSHFAPALAPAPPNCTSTQAHIRFDFHLSHAIESQPCTFSLFPFYPS